jgi:2-polyprenyl-6-methoxyphenol hydroxylase-like FAD-dependent oxidoreductase
MKVGVIGAGTAGSTAAVLLVRAGHTVDVFEKVDDPRAVGAGIMLQPTGQRVLRELGVYQEVSGAGTKLTRLHAVKASGRTLMNLRYPGDTCAFGIHRGVLFKTLLRAVEESAATLRCGVGIERVDRGFAGARAQRCARLIDERGRAWGPYDLVLVCDGARSRTRDTVGIPYKHHDYPWGVLWFVADDSAGHYRERLFQAVNGSREMLGLLPTGRGPSGEGPLVSFFWSIRDDAVDAFRRRGLVEWKRHILEMAPSAQPVLDQIESAGQLIFGDYRDVQMSRWHDGPVVVLGDAAHSMSPHLGQGANLALWDASVLAGVVADMPDPVSAAREYTRRRRVHLGYYQWATRALTPFFQDDGWLFGQLRDWGMPIASRMPFAQRIMMETMAGGRLGLFGGSVDLE